MPNPPKSKPKVQATQSSLDADNMTPAPVTPDPVLPTPVKLTPVKTKPQIGHSPVEQAPIIKPVANLARIRPRHRLLAISFCVMVVLPILISAAYLWGKAADQYASTVGFSVRREELASATDILGGLSALTKSSSSDTDILYEFLSSQKLVADLDAELDVRKIWSVPQNDPIFAFDTSGSIEDLVDYWNRMVRTSYDGNSGLIEVRVMAFNPEDATLIAQALFDKSSEMINGLSTNAREDTIRYARDELKITQDRVKAAREAITAFRIQHQIVDPDSDIKAQAGLVASLQNQLASAQIDADLLTATAPANDPRILQANQRIAVIEARISAERRKVSDRGELRNGSDYALLAAEYERLQVDREFTEKAYVSALASFDSAKADAQRKSRYLAAHILPTKAEVSRFPERWSLIGVLSLFLLLTWAISALVVYSLKDRR